ncbi:hypothetical protein RB195_020113 [Necator americanus]|uniref:UDP-glucuronosyltransferase n=1 Tax=Necator americanus TaxID=51031 RepID=A0ABR1CIP9_NECAM
MLQVLELCLIFLQCLLYKVNASNILIWNPTLGYSHVRFLGNIADVLTADGHNVTIFSSSMDSEITTFGNRLPARTIRFKSPGIDEVFRNLVLKGPSFWDTPQCDELCFGWSDNDLMNEQVLTYCKDLLEDTELLNSLNESKFELVYTEANDICAPGIFQILGIKNMVLAVAHTMVPRMYEVTGMSTLPSFMPEIVTPFSDDMTFVERMANFKISMQFMFHMRKWERIFWEHFNAKYPGFPAIREIYNEKTALIMTNVHEFAESPRPTTNMIRYIGGSTLYEAKPLEKDLDDLLNEREATVLFSLGSVAKSKNMPEWLRNDIIHTFNSFPNVTFIWKYEDDDLITSGSHPNIHLMRWIPQVDLLADKRLSLFITHGGMNSMLEAMHYGKPVIAIPLFGDQLHNSRNIPRLQIGNILDRTRISQKTLTEMIKMTLGNETILRNAGFVASQLAGRPQQYREDIARWAKVILEYGRMDHLILHSRNMNSIHIVAFKTGILLYKSL